MMELTKWPVISIAALALVVAGAAAGWTVNGWRLAAQLAALRASQTSAQAAQAQAAIRDLLQAAAAVQTAAADYAGVQNSLGTKIDTIQRSLKNAPPAPLPADCHPTADRVRAVSDAIAAANSAAADPR